MLYSGQDPITNGIDAGFEFTENDRVNAYVAIRAARADKPVSYQTIRRLYGLSIQDKCPSHQAAILLGRIVENDSIDLTLPKDNSGLSVGYDDATGFVWGLQAKHMQGIPGHD